MTFKINFEIELLWDSLIMLNKLNEFFFFLTFSSPPSTSDDLENAATLLFRHVLLTTKFTQLSIGRGVSR